MAVDARPDHAEIIIPLTVAAQLERGKGPNRHNHSHDLVRQVELTARDLIPRAQYFDEASAQRRLSWQSQSERRSLDGAG